MKTLEKLGTPIHSLGGQVVVDEGGSIITVGHIIGNALAGGQSPEPARMMKLALQFYDCPESLEIEGADFTLVLKTVQESTLANISKAAALAVLDGVGAG